VDKAKFDLGGHVVEEAFSSSSTSVFMTFSDISIGTAEAHPTPEDKHVESAARGALEGTRLRAELAIRQ
jgi:hypothetical protein